MCRTLMMSCHSANAVTVAVSSSISSLELLIGDVFPPVMNPVGIRRGPEFQPLSSESFQPLLTPFGTALFYKTHSISCIWATYHMAHIVLHRTHPSMPPISMAAAGVAARSTAPHANEIGRIAGGLALGLPDSPHPHPHHAHHHHQQQQQHTNPHLGAALLECSMAMFFAGVQYRDAAQRAWLAAKLRHISRATGWDSVATMAAGCEKAWEKAALMGRGPPYVRSFDFDARDERLAGRPVPGTWSSSLSSLSSSAAAEEPSMDSNDRRCIRVDSGARLHWAVGILGVEEDLAHLNLG